MRGFLAGMAVGVVQVVVAGPTGERHIFKFGGKSGLGQRSLA